MDAPRNATKPSSAAPRPHDAVAAALVAEFAEEKRVEVRAIAEAERKRNRRLPGWVAGSLAGAACLAAWFVPLPGTTPQPPALPPATFVMSSGRLTLTLAARRVEAFRARHGRLPVLLADAQAAADGIQYQRLTEKDFVLRLTANGTTLSYESALAPPPSPDDIKTIITTTGK